MEIGGVAIVRLTKVVGANEARILDWRNQLVAGCAVSPYKDLFIAPISVTYAVELLRKAGENQKAGIWHGSGEREVSYAEFAMLLADSLGVARSLVEPVASSESGARLTYSPSHAALGMQVTTAGFGLEPQPLEEVISQCVNSREVDSVDNRRGL
jgi:dTDP-4-dehydrorhamnose reductase